MVSIVETTDEMIGLSDIDSVLYFGEWIEFRPEIKVVLGLFEYECYLYDVRSASYQLVLKDWINKLSLTDCLNVDHIRHLILHGGFTLDEFIKRGYNSLDYLIKISKNPYVIIFLDNPGLLTLILDSPEKNEASRIQEIPRQTILKKLTGFDELSQRHLRRLSKVTPGSQTVSIMAKTLLRTLLWEGNEKLCSMNFHRRKVIERILSHQRNWLYNGLKLIEHILSNPDMDSNQYKKVLRAKNTLSSGGSRDVYHESVLQIIHLLEECSFAGDLTDGFFIKLKCISVNASDDRFKRLQKLRQILQSPPGHDYSFSALISVFEESDISTPILPSSCKIRHLNSSKRLRTHASKQRNCVWSPHMLESILQKEIDIYEMTGSNLVTLSINRKDLTINQIQMGQRSFIYLNELKEILSWYEEAIENRRERKFEPAINTLHLPSLLKK